jgi:hypothetical protein
LLSWSSWAWAPRQQKAAANPQIHSRRAERPRLPRQVGDLRFKGKHLHAATPTIEGDLARLKHFAGAPADCHRIVKPDSSIQ